MPVTVKTVESRKDLRAFVKFPLKLYKDCPHYEICPVREVSGL